MSTRYCRGPMPLNLNRAAMCDRRKVTVIGIPDAEPPYLSADALRAIAGAGCYAGGERHHALVAPLLTPGVEWIDIKAPVDAVFEAIGHTEGPVVVFASGDPLFYGFASTVLRCMPHADVAVSQWFNSLQTLAGRCLLPYQSMVNVSLTGRDWPQFDAALIEGHGMIGVLTDGRHTPDVIAHRMVDYGYDNYRVYVGEHLGSTTDERIVTGTVAEVADMTFARPNCMILCRESVLPRPFGVADDALDGLPGRPAMMTKRAVRLSTLSALDLRDRRCLWDVGFCTGSVSIEARLQFPHVQVVAFERRPECEAIIATNARRFHTPGIRVVMGDFLANCGDDMLPRPDAVFIGGHGGHLDEFVARVAALLPQGGVVVFNSVSDSSRADFLAVCEACHLTVGPVETLRVGEYNPITILKAIK